MAEWRDMGTAPRDAGIWMFLPGTGWTIGPDGIPSAVTNEVVNGGFDLQRGCWAVGNRTVYPSLWNDTPLSGPAPAQPVLP